MMLGVEPIHWNETLKYEFFMTITFGLFTPILVHSKAD